MNFVLRIRFGFRISNLALTASPSPPSRSPHNPADQTRRIVGRVYDDMQPRIVEINGYHMDMIPEGAMILIQNQDRPGMIGGVGIPS